MHDDFLQIGDFRIRQPEFTRLALPEGYVWSEDLRITQRDPWIALYRPLNLGLCYLHRSLLDGGALGSELSAILKSEHLLISSNAQMDSEEHKALVEQAHRGTFRFICILPTTACELKCAYCHQLVKKERAQRMSLEEIRDGLALAARLCTDESKPADVLIYGGEPLNAFDITEEVLKLTRPVSGLFRQPVRLTFTTSGVGLTDEQADILARHDVFVIVSIDGGSAVNDPVRRADDGFSSHAHAERACQILTERGCRVGLSVTIGKHNAADLERQVEYLIKRFGPNDIGLNAFLHRRGEAVNPYQVDAQAALKSVLSGLQVCRRFGVYAEQPFRRLRPFVFRQPLLKDCSAPG
ncbi:MAG TPA: radical SAM protein, partial [bacterium]